MGGRKSSLLSIFWIKGGIHERKLIFLLWFYPNGLLEVNTGLILSSESATRFAGRLYRNNFVIFLEVSRYELPFTCAGIQTLDKRPIKRPSQCSQWETKSG